LNIVSINISMFYSSYFYSVVLKLSWGYCQKAIKGEVESAAQKIIEEYSMSGGYYWNGAVYRECSELFSCDYSEDIDAIKLVV